MSQLFTAKDLSPKDYILKYSLIYLGMRKIKDEAIDKIKASEDNE